MKKEIHMKEKTGTRSCERSATETRARERQLGFGQHSWPPDPRTHAFYTIMHMC